MKICWKCNLEINQAYPSDGTVYLSHPPQYAHRHCPKREDPQIYFEDVIFQSLKTWPKYFREVWDGNKAFELRKNDRDFKVGQILHLREWEPKIEKYLGREILAEVVYMFEFQKDLPAAMIPREMVIMSIKVLKKTILKKIEEAAK